MVLKQVRRGKVQQHILTLLLAGAAISLSRSPRKQWRILTKELPKELARIRLQNTEYSLARLVEDKYIRVRKRKDGYVLELTAEGRKRAEIYSLDGITAPTNILWDKKWRFVLFDVPEKFRKQRDLLRYHLKRLGFIEVQKSAWCYPYECGREIQQLVRGLYLTKHVTYLVVTEFSHEGRVRKLFKL